MLQVGERYNLGERLGSGGMATVYLAHDRLLDRDVALKVLQAERAADPAFVERFRREARSAAGLNHPNVVAIFDQGASPPGCPDASADPCDYYIVMEYVSGGNLGERLARQAPLSEVESLTIAIAIASALGAAHNRGIIHRDVKPQNVLLTTDGRVKVADFGIARTAGTEPLTRTAEMLGSVHYLAPEQAQGKPVDARTDLYSLGVVLYEMLTGRAPFDGDTPLAVALRHVNEMPMPPRRLNPRISPVTEAIVLRALAKDPRERFQTAAAMQEVLEAARGKILATDQTTRTAASPVGGAAARTSAFVRTERLASTRVVRPTARPAAGRLRRRPIGRQAAFPLLLLLIAAAGALVRSQFGAAIVSAPGAAIATPIVFVGTVAAGSSLPAATEAVAAGSAVQSSPVSTSRVTPTSVTPPVRAVAPAFTATPTVLAVKPPVKVTSTATLVPLVTRSAEVSVAPSVAAATPAATTGGSNATAVPTATPSASLATAPSATPVEMAAGDPAQTVVLFYTLVSRHQFAQAASLWSPAMQAAYPPAQDLSGRFTRVQDMTVRRAVTTARTAGAATVAVDVVEQDANTTTAFREYVGSWQLVRGMHGWLLNQPDLRLA